VLFDFGVARGPFIGLIARVQKEKIRNKKRKEENMPHFTITYGAGTGLAEVARVILATAGQPFENDVFDRDAFPQLKHKFLFGQVPQLTVTQDDGSKFVLVQSTAIARYLANRFGLAGSTPEEVALADQWVDAVIDLRNELSKAFRSEDKEKAFG